jgi:hypothetical protein
MKICYIGTHDESSRALEEFCKRYDCTFEYDESAESSESLVSALRSAFKYNLIVVNLDCLHNKKIDDDFIFECMEQYKAVKDEVILCTDTQVSTKIKKINYTIVSTAEKEKLERCFSLFGVEKKEIIPKDLFSFLKKEDHDILQNFKEEVAEKADITENTNSNEETNLKKDENAQTVKQDKQTESITINLNKPKTLESLAITDFEKAETKSDDKANKPRVMSIEEKEKSVEKIERLKKSDISKDSKKTSEEKSEEKVKTKPVTLSDSLDSIEQIFGKMPVQLENIKKLNDDTTQEKPISNSQDKQQRVENIQPTTLTMNTEPIENTSFPQKQNSEFATYTQVKPESFDNKKDFDIPIQKRTIGVIGSLDRIGTTTQAIQITRFLSNIGQSVCYVQDNNSNFLDMLIKYYYDVNVDTGSECILYDGLYLNRKKNLVYDKEYEVEVYDYGCPVNIPSDFFEKNIRIVVCGGSPDEIDRLTAMISQLYSDDKIYYVFSFVANHDKQNVLDIMSERKSKCYFAPYSPDCFAQISDENADMYYDILGIEKPKKKKGLFRRGNKDAKV